MSSLKIDHVTMAGPALEPMQQAFAGLGLATDYGGPHSNGVTHMALLGFKDGSYIELISSLRPGEVETIFWGKHIMGSAGACAWALEVGDVAGEADRVAALGIPVDGPQYYYRSRPDGTLVEWDLAVLGDKGAGAKLPFLIKDITPRTWRVQPSASTVNSPLTGVVAVLLGVESLQETIALFRRIYGWSPPQIAEDHVFGAKLAHFTGTPVFLATPLTRTGWLAKRLARFDESPCAYLLGVTNFETARNEFRLEQGTVWFGCRLAWFDPAKLNGGRLGIIDSTQL